MRQHQFLQGAASAKCAVLTVLDGFAAAGHTFGLHNNFVAIAISNKNTIYIAFINDVLFLINRILDLGGDSAVCRKIGSFEQTQAV